MENSYIIGGNVAKSPQTNYFVKIGQYQKYHDISFIMLIIVTIVANFIEKRFILDAASIIIFILLIAIEVCIKNYRYKAELVRRMDFIDDSFGTNYVENSSEDYYDNSEIELGIYKMITNVFENVLFSSEISRRMYDKAIIKNLIAIIVLLGFAVLGFARSQYIGPMIQLFLSSHFVINWLDLRAYSEITDKIFLELKYLFDSRLKNTKESIEECLPEIIKIHLEYETNISDKKLSLDSKIYNELNPVLTNKWLEIKKKYRIIQNEK